MNQTRLPTPLRLRGKMFSPSRPAVMAIINLTRDSFYSKARHPTVGAAAAAADTAIEHGANIVDIGAVRAGQAGAWVSADEELTRLLPVVTAIRARHPEVLISIDTWRSEVISELGPGYVDLVNDTWAGHDPAIAKVAAQAGAGLVCSHTGGLPPRTDPVAVTYPPEPLGIVTAVEQKLISAAQAAHIAGIPNDRILLDPTLDFGKTTQHSLTLLRHTSRLASLGYPTMQAISRKDFVGETLGLSVGERLYGSLAATAVAAWQGASVFRTHDVRPTREVLDMVASIAGLRPPAEARRGT